MTAKKNHPAKRGRKPKAPGERLDQLTVRLPPMLKFGLELLANHQGRSLSDAMQWAVRVGLNSWAVGDGATLGDRLPSIFARENEARRLIAAYELSPSLLTFEDRNAVEYVLGSKEMQIAEVLRRKVRDLAEQTEKARGKKKSELNDQMHCAHEQSSALSREMHRLIAKDWSLFKSTANELANSGHGLKGHSLIIAKGLPVFHWHFDEIMKLLVRSLAEEGAT